MRDRCMWSYQGASRTGGTLYRKGDGFDRCSGAGREKEKVPRKADRKTCRVYEEPLKTHREIAMERAAEGTYEMELRDRIGQSGLLFQVPIEKETGENSKEKCSDW